MSAKNALVQATPYEVEQAVKKLGSDLRTARLRRNLTVDAIAAKIGTGRGAPSRMLKKARSQPRSQSMQDCCGLSASSIALAKWQIQLSIRKASASR